MNFLKKSKKRFEKESNKDESYLSYNELLDDDYGYVFSYDNHNLPSNQANVNWAYKSNVLSDDSLKFTTFYGDKENTSPQKSTNFEGTNNSLHTESSVLKYDDDDDYHAEYNSPQKSTIFEGSNNSLQTD